MTDRRLKAVERAAPRDSTHGMSDRGDLTGRAAAIFDELASPLYLSGRLNPENAYLFRLWCQTIAVAEDAGTKLQTVEAKGARTARERVADPRWRGFRDAVELATKLGKEFGLTPASQSTMKMPRPADSDAERLLSRGLS